ncbi:hypothetical protein M3210_12870 [Oceanobacillus luteolus]|uniref:Sporulation membrane protein YtrI n=1 Tax=Oceanobacillus luteolus TaxID=1274358 RepID=A0ABW4HQ74_9BACI|nr:sporulation membrane protein YtrI [Oceanobacillus luteolus]MCM3741163.1 hypothetical protein [Oceanobacillus luteolus]
MHFPPYYKRPGWQRFFVGMFTGGVIGYFILLYMYGSMYENLLTENYDLQEAIIDLREQNKVLLETQENQDTALSIQEIEIIISNPDIIKDSLLISQLKTLIKEEISHLIGVEVQVVSASEELLISAIENKAFTIDKVSYHFTVSRLTFAPKLKIVVDANILN